MNLKKGIKIGISSVLVVIIIILSYFIIANVVATKNNTISSFFGYSISYVPTESMEPNISKGSTIMFEQNTKYEDLNSGDIIVYRNEERNIYVIHRIKSGDITTGFIMQGDNNPTFDTNIDGTPLLVTSNNYIGKYVTTITAFSINSGFSRTIILIVCILIFVFIFLSEAISIVKLKKENDKEKNTKEELDEKEKLRQELLEELKEEMKNQDKK